MDGLREDLTKPSNIKIQHSVHEHIGHCFGRASSTTTDGEGDGRLQGQPKKPTQYNGLTYNDNNKQAHPKSEKND